MSILNALPKVSSVLGCCDLRKGCLVVGGLYVPLAATSIILSILYANRLDENADSKWNFSKKIINTPTIFMCISDYKAAYWSTVIFTVISVIDLMIPIFLLFGILKQRPVGVLVSNGLLFITVILYIVNSVVGFIAGPYYGTLYLVTLRKSLSFYQFHCFSVIIFCFQSLLHISTYVWTLCTLIWCKLA